MHEAKKLYEAPELTVFGSVEEVTQATWRLGSGDMLTQLIINVDTNCHSKIVGDVFCEENFTTGS